MAMLDLQQCSEDSRGNEAESPIGGGRECRSQHSIVRLQEGDAHPGGDGWNPVALRFK
uniref:Uncharacterized protein n=1 Tax=Anguilla anguilla TaxID=7936 RepID=A0A0E9W2I5_ANGAN